MRDIAFLLNGELVELGDVEPTQTLLDWLREVRGLCGTKEGCNEGDCGACTVMVTDEHGVRALNACILFLPQLHGRAVPGMPEAAHSPGNLLTGTAPSSSEYSVCRRRWMKPGWLFMPKG